MSSNQTTIKVYSHGVLIKPGNNRARDALLDYSYSLCQYGMVKRPPSWKMHKVILKVFAGWDRKRTEFRFHVSLLNDIYTKLGSYGIYVDSIKVIHMKKYEGVKVDFSGNTLYPPKEYQIPIIEHLSDTSEIIRVTNLQTGKGKTLCALHAMANVGVRTMIHLAGGYVHRWIPDLEKFFKFKKGELLVIRGRDSLISLINMAKFKDPALDRIKVIIITSKTVFNYLKAFDENVKRNIYDVRPEDLYETIGVGLKIVDELHEDYHLNFRSDIYMNVPNSIYLSATLDTKDEFRRRMYNIAHPPERWVSTTYDAYVKVIAKNYTMNEPGSIETTHRGGTNYSHSAYELNILKDAKLKENYLKIILNSFYNEFFVDPVYETGQKVMIFCSTIDMCNAVTDYIKTKVMDLTVNTYVSETPPEVLHTTDIIVTTVESAGTAVDVKGLKVAVLTRALDKFEKNEQIKGRLRKMSPPWDHIDPVLIYLNNVTIEKHMQYHRNKLKDWEGLVLSHTTKPIPIKL